MTDDTSTNLLRRCGVSQVTTPMWTVAEDAEALPAAGFAAIGIWLHKLEMPRLDGGFFMPEKHIPQPVVDDAVTSVRTRALPSPTRPRGGYPTQQSATR